MGKAFGIVLATALMAILLIAGWYSYQMEEINVPFQPFGLSTNFMAEWSRRFPGDHVSVKETGREQKWRYTKQHLKISSVYGDSAGDINAIWWIKNGGSHQKIIIILPIAGSYDPGRILASFFLHGEGYDVLQIFGGGNKRFLDEQDFLGHFTLSDTEEAVWKKSYFLQLRLATYIQAVYWLKAVKGYKDIFLLGVSLGAIEGSILALDPNIRASVLVMGGGDLAEIIMYSKEPFVRRWREELLREIEKISGKKPSYKEVLKMLRDNLSGADPLKYVSAVDSRKVMMITAKYDETIPLRNAFKLWLTANQPCLFIFPTTHRGMAFYAPAVLYHASRFFKQDH